MLEIDCLECHGTKYMEGSTPSCMGGAKVPCEYCDDGKIKVYTEAEVQKLKDDINEGGQKYLELQIKNKKLRDALKHIIKYWNGTSASAIDAIEEAIEVGKQALKDGE